MADLPDFVKLEETSARVGSGIKALIKALAAERATNAAMIDQIKTLNEKAMADQAKIDALEAQLAALASEAEAAAGGEIGASLGGQA